MNRYPTDEELSRLIETLEHRELYAPKNLKHQILERGRRDGILEEVAKTEAFKAKVSVQLFAYSFKVLAGMAAAIAMLVVLPMQDSEAAGGDRIALREQKQTEELKAWEEAQQKEMQAKEKREAILQQSKGEAEKRIADVVEFFEDLWNRETEEN